MNSSMFGSVVALDQQCRTRGRRDRRAGCQLAPDHPVLDLLLGAVTLMVLVAVAGHR